MSPTANVSVGTRCHDCAEQSETAGWNRPCKQALNQECLVLLPRSHKRTSGARANAPEPVLPTMPILSLGATLKVISDKTCVTHTTSSEMWHCTRRNSQPSADTCPATHTDQGSISVSHTVMIKRHRSFVWPMLVKCRIVLCASRGLSCDALAVGLDALHSIHEAFQLSKHLRDRSSVQTGVNVSMEQVRW